MTEKVVRFENCPDLEDEEPEFRMARIDMPSLHPSISVNGQLSSPQESIESNPAASPEKPDKWKSVTSRIRTALVVKNAVKPARTRRRSLWRSSTENIDPFIQKFSTRSDRKTPPKRKSSHKEKANGNNPEGKTNALGTVIELDSTISRELDSDCTSVYDYETSWSATFKEIPTVVSPDGRFMYIWFYFSVFAIRYNLWVIILRIAFPAAQTEFTVVWFVFDYFCDFLYLLDVLISFRTGFLEEGILVTDVKRIAKRYVFSNNFIADFLSVLPTDLLFVLYPDKLPILRINRLIKSYKSFTIKSLMESHTSYPTFLRVFFLLHLMFLLINWNAGFYIMISRAEGFGSNKWVYPGNGSLYQQYLKSLYWSTLTLTAIGDLPSPATNFEYLYTIACYLCGVFMFATIVGNAGSIIVNRNASRLDFERQREGTNNYMRKNTVPRDLKRRVLMWYDYSWTRGRIGSGGGDLNSLTLLPDKLKTEIALHVNLETLRKVTFLQKCQPEFLHDLVLMMKMRIFTPGDYICRKGEVAREMYVIIDGKIEVVGEGGQVLKVLSGGDFFGEIGILSLSEGQNRRTADVRAIGYVECFVLSKDDVLRATRDYPEAQAVLAEYGRRRLEGQATRKDPRLVDMEDCSSDKNGNEGNLENGFAPTLYTDGSAASMTLPTLIRSRSSSSSSASLLTPVHGTLPSLQPQASRALPQAPNTQPQATQQQPQPTQMPPQGNSLLASSFPVNQIADSPTVGYMCPRRSSRAGLLDPLPVRRESLAGPYPLGERGSILPSGSELQLGISPQHDGELGNEAEVTSSDIDSSIMRLMTASCGEVIRRVRTAVERRLERDMDKLKSEIETLKANLAEKNDNVSYLKSHIATQEVELGAWRQAVQELEHERLRRDDEMQHMKEELTCLRDELCGSSSKKRRQGTTISMTSLLPEDQGQC